MADLISAQLPDELLLDILNHSISDYGLVNDFWDSIATLRLTLHFRTQISALEEWKRRTQALLYLSRVSKSWFRVATPLLYEVIRINSPTMVFALIRASSEAPVLLEHTKHLSFEIYYPEGALQTDESSLSPGHVFKELASRCPNLWVLQNCCPDSSDDHYPTVFPSLRLYEGLLHALAPSNQTTLQYLILCDGGAPLHHNLQGLSFPVLHVLDLTRTDWVNYSMIMSWEMPTLKELRGKFNQQRVSYEIIAKTAKTLRRLQIHVSNLDELQGLSDDDIDAPIPLPHLSEVIVRIDDGVSVGLRPRYFKAFCSLDSLRSITMSIPKISRTFISTSVSFIQIFEGPTTSRTPKPLTIRIGEASLKPQMGEWAALRSSTFHSWLQRVVRKLSNYGANVLFAMPDGTYDTLHWFSFKFYNHHWS